MTTSTESPVVPSDPHFETSRKPQQPRVNVNLTARAFAALEALEAMTENTKTDVINRALQIYHYLEEIQHHGGAIYVRDDAEAPPRELKIF